MENKNVKNYGCISVIVALYIIYIILSAFVYVTDTIAGFLSNPIINYGIPVGIILYLIIKDSFKK